MNIILTFPVIFIDGWPGLAQSSPSNKVTYRLDCEPPGILLIQVSMQSLYLPSVKVNFHCSGDYWEKGVPWPGTSSTLADTDVSLSSPATINTICNGTLDRDRHEWSRRIPREQFSVLDTAGWVVSIVHDSLWSKL